MINFNILYSSIIWIVIVGIQMLEQPELTDEKGIELDKLHTIGSGFD